MMYKRPILSIAVVITLVLFLQIANHWVHDPSPDGAPPQTAPVNLESGKAITAPPPSAALPGTVPRDATVLQSNNHPTGSKLIEIFGRVVDRDQQPIEGVLITEERYFFATRSDALGHYRILLDMPRHRFPTILFLRHGYSGKRIIPDTRQLQQSPVLELNLDLEENPDSIRLPVWVGNEAGEPLEAVRVELSAPGTDDEGDFSLTLFTDSNGWLDFEGVLAGLNHRLAAYPSPGHDRYRDDDLFVSANPEPVNIVLKSLRLVDIDGMIQNHESAPVPDFQIEISNLSTGAHRRKVTSDASGFFTLRNFPRGTVILTTSLSDQGAEYFRISGLTLTDAEYRNLILIVDKGSHYLSGWVSDKNEMALTKAMVTLEARVQDGSIVYLSYRSQITDAGGRFVFAGIGGGEHKLSVYADGFAKQELIHHFNTHADQIQVRLARQQ